jgi:hypothetical protein
VTIKGLYAEAKCAKGQMKIDSTPIHAVSQINKEALGSRVVAMSRKSNLSYELGQDSAKGFHYRIVSCDGGGFFSPEWVAWTAIQTAIQTAIKKSVGPLTSLCLRPLFKGKSVNTSGYLLAALVAEGLLEPLPKKIRHFRLTGNNPEAAKTKPRSTPAKKAKATNPKAAKA